MSRVLCRGLDKSPLEWWMQQKIVSMIPAPHTSYQKDSLHITATSCPKERLFNAVSNLVNLKRNCLIPGNVDRMLFV